MPPPRASYAALFCDCENEKKVFAEPQRGGSRRRRRRRRREDEEGRGGGPPTAADLADVAASAECVVGDLRKKSLGRTVIVAVVAISALLLRKARRRGQTKKCNKF